MLERSRVYAGNLPEFFDYLLDESTSLPRVLIFRFG
jgi:hypothetical protein